MAVGVPSATAVATSKTERAGDDGEAGEKATFVVGEEVDRPVDRGAQGLLAAQFAAARPREQREAVAEPTFDVGQAHRAGPTGGELDREGHAVETGADPRDRLEVFGGWGEVRCDRDDALHEEAYRIRVGTGFERPDGDHVLAIEVEVLARCREEPQRRDVVEQPVDELGDVVDQVLAVVDDHEGVARGEMVAQLPVGRGGRGEFHRAAHGREDAVGLVDLGQVREVHAAGERGAHAASGFDGEARLADAAGADERDQPGIVEPGPDRGDLTIASEQAGAARREGVARTDRSPQWPEVAGADLQ